MVAIAIPGAGPAVAAVVSIFEVMYDEWGRIPVRTTYSVSAALMMWRMGSCFDLTRSKTDTTPSFRGCN